MSLLLDTSILVEALRPDAPHHASCLALLEARSHCVYAHALLETFSTLTGNPSLRVQADFAARLLKETILPRVTVISLDNEEIVAALNDTRKHGVRGGAIYDYMHVLAARKAGVEAIKTLNMSDFMAITQHGGPEVRLPL
jgi:predicted nucleic acid-binding protein